MLANSNFNLSSKHLLLPSTSNTFNEPLLYVSNEIPHELSTALPGLGLYTKLRGAGLGGYLTIRITENLKSPLAVFML